MTDTTPDLTVKTDQIVTDVGTITGAVAKIATATTWTAIVGFFTALPGIIALVQNFMSWLNLISGNNPQALIKDFGNAFSLLSKAQTPEEKQNAASNLASVIGKLPS